MNTKLCQLGEYVSRMGRGEVPYDPEYVRQTLRTIEREDVPEWILTGGAYILRETNSDRSMSAVCTVERDDIGRWKLRAEILRTAINGGALDARILAVEWCKRLGILPNSVHPMRGRNMGASRNGAI